MIERTPSVGFGVLDELPAPFEQWVSPAGGLALFGAEPPASRQAVQALHTPLLLLHSINAAGSAAEMAPLFAHYRGSRAVYALDFPGFGLSERTDRIYTPRLMTDAVLAALARIHAQHGTAVDVVALSLAAEFAARAQSEQPEMVRRLALISPTGFAGKRRFDGPAQSTRGIDWLHRALTFPLWSDALYSSLTRPGVVRYFLQRSCGSKEIDETLWAAAVQTARQTGARHAPLYFLSAHLFSADIHTVYQSVSCPVWVSMATKGDFTNYEARKWFQDRSNWHFHTIAGGALPYFEDLAAFAAELDPFLNAG